jgi:hypothetical protein
MSRDLRDSFGIVSQNGWVLELRAGWADIVVKRPVGRSDSPMTTPFTLGNFLNQIVEAGGEYSASPTEWRFTAPESWPLAEDVGATLSFWVDGFNELYEYSYDDTSHQHIVRVRDSRKAD